jgi:hypothetical protein
VKPAVEKSGIVLAKLVRINVQIGGSTNSPMITMIAVLSAIKG